MERCPSCDSPDLVAVWDGDTTNFLCRACGTCWHSELGWVSQIDPRDCRGVTGVERAARPVPPIDLAGAPPVR